MILQYLPKKGRGRSLTWFDIQYLPKKGKR